MSKKEAYANKLKARLDKLEADIDRLKARAGEAGADAQLEYHEHIEELRSMRQDAHEKLLEIRRAGDDAWEDLKVGASSAWDSIDSAVKRATDRFK